jgi:hypothetical protein
MHTSIGKPLVALASAACLALPAANLAPIDRDLSVSTMAVNLTAAATAFDPVPASARAISAPSTDTDPTKLVAAVDQMAELSGVDRATLLLELLSAPYHNVYGVSIAVGKAVNAVVQLVSLPFSIATYVLTNRTSEIPTYINTIKTNLAGALPGISASVKSEIQYDIDLLSQIFGGSTTTETATQATVEDVAVTADAATSNEWLQLLAIPYHNAYAVSIAVGKAVNAVVQLVSLPFSAFTYVLTNRTSEIPAYITTVQTNLKNALPGISSTIKSEVAYDKNLFQQVFGGGEATSGVQSSDAATGLGSESHASLFNAGVHPLLAEAFSAPQADDAQASADDTGATADDTATNSTKQRHGLFSAKTDTETTTVADTEDNVSTEDSGSKPADDKSSAAESAGTEDDTSAGAEGTSSTKTKSETPSADSSSTDSASTSTTTKATGGKHRRSDAA